MDALAHQSFSFFLRFAFSADANRYPQHRRRPRSARGPNRPSRVLAFAGRSRAPRTQWAARTISALLRKRSALSKRVASLQP